MGASRAAVWGWGLLAATDFALAAHFLAHYEGVAQVVGFVVGGAVSGLVAYLWAFKSEEINAD